MMKIEHVKHLSKEELTHTRFDASIFSSGFEKRASSVAKFLERASLGVPYTIGFSEFPDIGARRSNDRFFERLEANTFIFGNYGHEEVIRSIVNSPKWPVNKLFNVLIDYSSMSRAWYSLLLDWFLHLDQRSQCRLIFTYAEGRYTRHFPPKVIKGIRTVPGCAGQPDPTLQTVAILILGFDPIGALAVLEDLEPDITIAVVAGGTGKEQAKRRAISANKPLLSELRDSPLIELPLLNVQDCVAQLREVCAAYYDRYNIVIVPFGPKTLTLASILVTKRFPRASCLSADGIYDPPILVNPTGALSIDEVLLEPAT